MSPCELSVVLETATERKSVTLAGDVAQRLHMDNGFRDWRQVLRDLGLDSVSIEPLRLSYRSTKPIIELAEAVLGPLKNEQPGEATREGAPVELFRFGHPGDAVGFLAEALRELVQDEPLASIAVISRYPEQADLYFRGLKRAEVPHLRRGRLPGFLVPSRRRRDRRPAGQGPRVRLRRDPRNLGRILSRSARCTAPSAHRGHPGGPPAVALHDR